MAAQQIGTATGPTGAPGSRPEVVEWTIDHVPARSRPAVGADGTGDPRRPRGQRRLTVAIAAVVAAVVIAAGLVIVRSASSDDASRFASTAPTTDVRPSLAPGWQRVSSLGVEVDAPASWPINAWDGCAGALPAAQITRGQFGAPLCLRGPDAPPVTSVLDIGRPGAQNTNQLGPAPTVPPSTRVETAHGGEPVTISSWSLPGGRTYATLTFRHRNVQVTAASPDAALVQRIITSAWPVAVDSLGCPTDLPPNPSWNVRAGRPGVDIGHPTSITACYYPYDRSGPEVLGASAELRGAAARTAAETINSAKPGAVPDNPTSCGAGGPDSRLVLRVRQPDGTTVEAWVRFEGCTDRWVATPTGMSQSTQAQLTALMRPLATGYSSGADLPQH